MYSDIHFSELGNTPFQATATGERRFGAVIVGAQAMVSIGKIYADVIEFCCCDNSDDLIIIDICDVMFINSNPLLSLECLEQNTVAKTYIYIYIERVVLTIELGYIC